MNEAAEVTQSYWSWLVLQHCYKESKMYYGKQLSRIGKQLTRIARLLCIYENRYQVVCPIMQNAAVQEIFCTKLDTCDQ